MSKIEDKKGRGGKKNFNFIVAKKTKNLIEELFEGLSSIWNNTSKEIDPIMCLMKRKAKSHRHSKSVVHSIAHKKNILLSLSYLRLSFLCESRNLFLSQDYSSCVLICSHDIDNFFVNMKKNLRAASGKRVADAIFLEKN